MTSRSCGPQGNRKMTCYLSWDGNESEPPSSPRSPAAPTNRPSLVWPQPMVIPFNSRRNSQLYTFHFLDLTGLSVTGLDA
ncbi:hypothetical protein ACFXTH_001521 [Malus domestica]